MAKRTEHEPNQHVQHVGEARAEYRADVPKYDPRADHAYVTLSSKNQITLPVGMVRVLGLRPGDELTLTQMNGRVLLGRRLQGQELMESLAGSVRAPQWETKEKIDEWLRIVREGGELP